MRLVFILLFFGVFQISAQELKPGQYMGYIIDKDGNKKEGVIETKTYAPWENQRKIKFITLEKWNSGDKIKNKDKEKLSTKNITEYGYDDKVFVKVNYKNLAAIGESANNEKLNRFNKLSSGLKNMKSTYFAEVYQLGSMSMYKFYNSPPDVSISSEEETEELKRLAEECRINYDILVQKEGEGAKQFEGLNIKKYFKNCKEVSEKYKNKEYTKKPVKGLKSMVKNAFLVGDALAAAAKEMVDDYNLHCGE